MTTEPLPSDAPIDWSALAKEATAARTQLWNALIEHQTLLDEDVSEAASEIGAAYTSLRLDYLTARTLLEQGIAPQDEDLDPEFDPTGFLTSRFKTSVLASYAMIDHEISSQAVSNDEQDAPMRIYAELQAAGALQDPLL